MVKKSTQFWTILLFSIGVFMAQLDNGIISSALTTINRSYNVTDNWGAWGITIYTLGLAISLPIVGKLSDRYGRKKLFIIEIALFAIGSLLVALSPSFNFYLAARFIQALGGGGIFIIGNSHILSTVEPNKQAKYLGLLGAMNGVAAVLGPNLGSFLLDLTGNWHFLFLINVPIAIILLILGLKKLKESADPNPGRLDLMGTIILSFAILSIMYGLTNIDVNFWASFKQIEVSGYLGAGLILFILLLIYESSLARKQDADPILPIHLIKQSRFLVVLVIGALSGGLLASMIFIPAFTENVLGIAAEKSGYWMTPLALAAGVGAGLGGVLVTKRGPVFAVIMSGFISAIGFALFPLWITMHWQFVISSMVAGAGIGIILGAPLNILATEGLQSDKGTALASLSLLRQIGMTIAPTIYAGFIARSYKNMTDVFASDFQGVLHDKVAQTPLSQDALGELAEIGQRIASEPGAMDPNQIQTIMEAIQDPLLKEVILSSVSELTTKVAESGYNGLYWSAAILGVLIIGTAFILKPLRDQSLARHSE